MFEDKNPYTLYDILTFCSLGNPARQRVRCPVCDSLNLTTENSITDRVPGDKGVLLVKLMKLVITCRDCDYVFESENVDKIVKLS